MARTNLFVLAVYDRGNKTSCFEVYSFRSIGLVSDKFLLRSPSEKQDDFGGSGGRMSLINMNTDKADMEQNIDFARQRMSEFKDTNDTSNLQLLYRSVVF